ncbi:hypothetical protein ABW19_dt0202882 [Dactylella cylindrospora]|nr:hypothetical protein ABW19_dt0202882 [Dactylella cylindrospora]
MNLNDLFKEITSLLAALQSALSAVQTTTSTAVTTSKLATTSSSIRVTSTSATAKASITSPKSTAPTSSVRKSTTSTSKRSSASTKTSSGSLTTSSPNISSVLSSLSSQVSSFSPAITGSIPSVDAQLPSSISASIPPPLSVSTSSFAPNATATSALPTASASFQLISRALILAVDNATAGLTTQPLDGYGMSYDLLIVPKAGIVLPDLNTTSSAGYPVCNYNMIIAHSQLSFNYGGDDNQNWRSALTPAQWNQIWAYQTLCNVRLIHFNVWPGPDFGVSVASGGCCSPDDPQNVTIVGDAASRFRTSGLKPVPLSLANIYHVPALVTDTNTTQTSAFLEFSPNSVYLTNTAGGVINTYPDGRSQMAFFISFGSWSPTSAYLNHIWIHWATHGLYDGYRRVYLSTQIDDVLLETNAWDTGIMYRTSVTDMVNHANWVSDLNSRLTTTNAGSKFFVELGLNGNGNLLASNALDPNWTICRHAPIWYAKDPDTTPLEFQKALGTGTNSWPDDPASFSVYSMNCLKLDPLAVWLWTSTPARTAFSFVSHTYTHLGLNNATYNDTYKEINWNLQYFSRIGLDKHVVLSKGGLIPPAITGMHNGDALRAMWDNSVWNSVGDNTRPPLRNSNHYYPLITTVAKNGFDGFQITPRWATRIYFNCDTADCTVAEWVATSGGYGNINDLLAIEKESTINSLLNLMHDPYMFHQANMRTEGLTLNVSIAGTSLSAKYSLLQMWTETMVNELQRIINWPILTLKHDDLSTAYKNRMIRDQCDPQVAQIVNKGKVTSVIVSTPSGSCSAEVPVTVPGGVRESGSNIRVEQIGADSPTIWVKLNGQPVTLTLTTPLDITAL